MAENIFRGMCVERIITVALLENLTDEAMARVRRGDMRCYVRLACGHFAFTRPKKRMTCKRCREMLRRSIADGSEDYESFRKGLVPDTMEWPADPVRGLNESSRDHPQSTP